MPRNFPFRPILTAVVPTLFLSSAASGEILPPGGIAEDFATSLNMRPDLGGELEAMQFVPFSLADDSGKTFYSGQIVQDVMRDPKTGTLSFCYRFENSPGDAVLGIDTLTASTFHGYDAEVAILADTTGDTAPIDALRSRDGSEVTFDFDAVASRIAPNDSSLTFLVKTNATHFDGGGAANISAFIADSTEEGSPILAGGTATISSFRPIGEPVVLAPRTPVTVSVPLPPPFWTAVPTMIGSAIYIRRLRKRQGHG